MKTEATNEKDNFKVELTDLNVGSLNVCGLKFSKKRKARIQAIAKYLRESDYDIVGLQELWMRKDYEFLTEALKEVFPFSYYFKSGQIGSGLATFSKYPIKQALFHRYLLNGQAHHVWHGDWWSGKGVGLTCIEIDDGISINFFNTHLHAEYDRENNGYLGHRLTQMQQLFEFVHMSKQLHETVGTNLNLIVGDLNALPNCFTYDLFIKKDVVGCGIVDAGLEFSAKTSTELIDSFGLQGNSFSKKGKDSQRIDYILYSAAEGFSLKEFSVLQEDRLAEAGKTSLSDHTPIGAKFEIQASASKSVSAAASKPVVSNDEYCGMIKQAIAILSKDIYFTKQAQTKHLVLSVVQLAIFLAVVIAVSVALTFASVPLFVTLLTLAVMPGFLIGAIFSGIVSIVWLSEELAHLHGFASQWNLALIKRGVETMPINGIVEAMRAHPKAIEQMCTITGQKFDKAIIKKILREQNTKAKRLSDVDGFVDIEIPEMKPSMKAADPALVGRRDSISIQIEPPNLESNPPTVSV